ncbi:MAG: hypothetical protein IIZ49_02505, partial [Oscillospiraceae bacterium]|nr:hypothetical protein [Oscillospiraceae bacterium]
MRDTVWQYMPFDPYDIESIEAWLAGLCEKGLVPERVTRAFVRCRRESGEECRVRAIPAAHTREEEPPDAQRELFVSPCYALRQREFAQDRDMPRTLYADVYFCRIPALNRRIAL